MGLDGVELLMAVEDRFQVALDDDSVGSVRTPGELVTLLLARLGSSSSPACLEQRAFYRLRRACLRVFEVPRIGIRPETRWEHVIPRPGRRHYWRLVRDATAAPLWPWLTPFLTFPAANATLGATARWLAAACPAAFKAPGEGWARKEVEDGVRTIVCEQLGLKTFEWDDEFVADLGMN